MSYRQPPSPRPSRDTRKRQPHPFTAAQPALPKRCAWSCPAPNLDMFGVQPASPALPPPLDLSLEQPLPCQVEDLQNSFPVWPSLRPFGLPQRGKDAEVAEMESILCSLCLSAPLRQSRTSLWLSNLMAWPHTPGPRCRGLRPRSSFQTPRPKSVSALAFRKSVSGSATKRAATTAPPPTFHQPSGTLSH